MKTPPQKVVKAWPSNKREIEEILVNYKIGGVSLEQATRVFFSLLPTPPIKPKRK